MEALTPSMPEIDVTTQLIGTSMGVEGTRSVGSAPSSSGGEPRSVGPEPRERKKILCVDDSRDFTIFLKILLEDHGYQALIARDGREGLQLIERNDIDLVVLDVMMPKKTGFVLFRELRRKTQYRHLPVLMLTGVAAQLAELDEKEADTFERPYDRLRESLRNMIREMRDSGEVRPEMFVDKPIDPNAFIETVRNLIGD